MSQASQLAIATRTTQNTVSAFFDGLTTSFAVLSFAQVTYASIRYTLYHEVAANNLYVNACALAVSGFFMFHEATARYAARCHDDYNDGIPMDNAIYRGIQRILRGREHYFSWISAFAGCIDFAAMPSALLELAKNYVRFTGNSLRIANIIQLSCLCTFSLISATCLRATYVWSLKHIYDLTNPHEAKVLMDQRSSTSQNRMKAFTEGMVSFLTITSFITSVADDIMYLLGQSAAFNSTSWLIGAVITGFVLAFGDAVSHANQYENANSAGGCACHQHNKHAVADADAMVDVVVGDETRHLLADSNDSSINISVAETTTHHHASRFSLQRFSTLMLSICCTIACSSDVAGLPSAVLDTLSSMRLFTLAERDYHLVRLSATGGATLLAAFTSISTFAVSHTNNKAQAEKHQHHSSHI